MIINNLEQISKIRASLLSWFKSNGRHYIPWKLTRKRTIPTIKQKLDVYPIWVAEIMLQQTQLKVVLPYWENWMKTFPTLDDLAAADERDVLLAWQGLGYYSRVKRLHASAKILLTKIGLNNSSDPSKWPKDIESWMLLPGVGRSTAGSILSSAFNYPTSLLDGNVKRILTRLIGSSEIPSKDLKRLWKLSDALLDQKFPRDFNQALMDLGATICSNRNPSCFKCPLKNYCAAYASGKPSNFPKKGSGFVLPEFVIGIGIVLNDSKEVLIDQRPEESSMAGMWEFPGGKQEKNESMLTTIQREILEELDIKVEVGNKLIEFDHSYSHKKFHFVVHLCSFISGTPKPLASQKIRWVLIEDLVHYPFPAANTRIIKALKEYIK